MPAAGAHEQGSQERTRRGEPGLAAPSKPDQAKPLPGAGLLAGRNIRLLQQSLGNASFGRLLSDSLADSALLPSIQRQARPAPTRGARRRRPPTPLTAEQRDERRYQSALAGHRRDLARLDGFVKAGLHSRDIMTRNSCQQVTTHRMKVYALTPTHDSASRAAAAGHPGGVAYFSYPAGALYEAVTPYTRHRAGDATWNNSNVEFEDSPTVDGFQSPGKIAFMHSAIAQGRDYFWSVLRHEVQHFVDLHGDTDIEGYKTEFRAYWLGSREYNRISPTRMVRHKGYRWNARQYAIFNNLYTSTDYAYVKTAWDAENGQPAASRTFQNAVVAFTRPESINPQNSVRIADFITALQAVSPAACARDTAASPDPSVAAVRRTLRSLDWHDRNAARRSSELQALIRSKTSGRVTREITRRLRR